MRDVHVVMHWGETLSGPLWTFRPLEGWFSLIGDDPDRKIYLMDCKSAIQSKTMRSTAGPEDIDLHLRAKEEGWKPIQCYDKLSFNLSIGQFVETTQGIGKVVGLDFLGTASDRILCWTPMLFPKGLVKFTFSSQTGLRYEKFAEATTLAALKKHLESLRSTENLGVKPQNLYGRYLLDSTLDEVQYSQYDLIFVYVKNLVGLCQTKPDYFD